MPIFQLTEDFVFPPVHRASDSGILAIGGDLSPGRLLTAYRLGIFPWYSKDDPIIWWSPDPRFVLFPGELHISRSMKKVLRQNSFRITYDHNFFGVITACRKPRPKEKETWITKDMLEAYCSLHLLGYAHSAEAWCGEHLVGGIYGVSLGRCFFGESMFSLMDNASKAALVHLVGRLKNLNFQILDCQVYTSHMETLGARFMPREKFITLLEKALNHDTLRGNWGCLPEFN
jgi:leucyl/phenylalanyl-tRNA--protein transferase